MTFGSDCNCGNCTKYSESNEIDNAHPGNHVDVFCLCNGEYIPPEQMRCTQRKGCLSHPRAREVMMADVIKELERRAIRLGLHNKFETVDTYNQAIKLIRGEKE